MTDTAISPLRQRMIEDMQIRKFTPGTQHNYVRFVKEFSIFRISDVTNSFRCRPPNGAELCQRATSRRFIRSANRVSGTGN